MLRKNRCFIFLLIVFIIFAKDVSAATIPPLVNHEYNGTCDNACDGMAITEIITDYACRLEHTQEGVPYCSLAPLEIHDLTQEGRSKVVDGETYYYVLDMLTFNYYDNKGGRTDRYSNNTLSYDSIMQTIKDSGRLLGNIDEYELVDVYHLGQNNYTWNLYDHNGNNPDGLDIRHFIDGFDTWVNLGTGVSGNVFYPLDNATYDKDNGQINLSHNYKNNFRNLGINIQYNSSYPKSYRVYSPIIYKFKSNVKRCYYDEENDKLYNDEGNEVNFESKVEQEDFVNRCLCDLKSDGTKAVIGEGTPKNTDLYNKLLSKMTEETKDYFNLYCKPQTEIQEPDVCEVTVENKACDADGNTFSIGYLNDDCIFNEKNINKTVLDNSTDKNDLTYAKNEYCSLTCAEKIDFELPEIVSDPVVAGQYWIWDKEKIKITGTRKCQSTVDVEKFETDTKAELQGEIKDRIVNIYNKNTGNSATNSNANYGLSQQLGDLKVAYDDYSNINDAKARAENVCAVCLNYGQYGCTNYGYSIKYTYESNVTGEVFERYERNNGSCETTEYKSTSNSKKPNELKTVLESKFASVKNSLQTKINNVNACTDELLKTNNTGMSASVNGAVYEFSPDVEFSYEDEKYNDYFTSKKFIKEISQTEFQTSNLNANKDGSVSYIEDITSATLVTENYYTKKDNNLVYKKSKTYSNPLYFYIPNIKFNTGVLDAKAAGNNPENYQNNTISDNTSEIINSIKADDNYYFGNIYPVSLNVGSGRYSYQLHITNLGVGKNGKNNGSNGRFNQMLGNNPLKYICYYDVENDVTTPSKPNFFFRNISLNNFDPNNRETNGEMGKNWTNIKGQKAQCDIAKGSWNEVTSSCSDTNNNPEDIYNDPEYSFTLTPQNIANIREYNKNNKFSDFKMKAYTGQVNGDMESDVQNVWYTSDFLKTAVDNEYASKATYDTEFTGYKEVDKNNSLGPAWK